MTWGRIRSWHALPPTRALVPFRTLCGRNVPTENRRSESLPDGKSCETCLRALAKLNGE